MAILGGGYFTFKSFAATASFVYNRQSGNLGSGVTELPNNPCKSFPFNDPAKNNQPVWSISCPYSSNTYGTAFVKTATKSLYTTNEFGSYRACAMVKGKGTFTVGIDARGGKTQKYYKDSNSYTAHCSPTYSSSTSVQGYVDITTKNSATWINVSSITIEKMN